MKILFRYLKNALVVILILVAIWVFAVENTQTLPKYAEVMVNDSLKVYYSPMYFYDYKVKGWEKLRLTTYAEAKSKGYDADDICRKQGYFVHEQGSPIWGWLDSAGIWKLKHRWNPDGSWNW